MSSAWGTEGIARNWQNWKSYVWMFIPNLYILADSCASELNLSPIFHRHAGSHHKGAALFHFHHEGERNPISLWSHSLNFQMKKKLVLGKKFGIKLGFTNSIFVCSGHAIYGVLSPRMATMNFGPYRTLRTPNALTYSLCWVWYCIEIYERLFNAQVRAHFCLPFLREAHKPVDGEFPTYPLLPPRHIIFGPKRNNNDG